MNDIFIFPVGLKYDEHSKKVTKRPQVERWQNPDNCIKTTAKELDDLELKTGSGIGVLCGAPSNLVVIDFDNSSDSNFSMLATFRSVQGLNRNTMIVKTQSGGFHFYYRSKDAHRIKSGTNLRPSVDVRANGGFVVGPGSHCATPDGDASYTIVNGGWDTIATISPKLIVFLRQQKFLIRADRHDAAIKKLLRQNTTTDPLQVRDALRFINIEDGDYSTWFTITCALQSEAMFTEFLSWSATQPGYKGTRDCERAWGRVSAGRVSSPVGIGTLFHIAKSCGWNPQKSNEAKSISFKTSSKKKLEKENI